MKIINLEQYPDYEVLHAALSRLVMVLLENGYEELQELEILQEYTDGKSGTRVFLVKLVQSTQSHHDTRVVFKVGKAGLLKQEIKAYQAIEPYIKENGLFLPSLKIFLSSSVG